ncbi:MAG TPA: hypothetical protein VGL06_25235 [Pseudonocardiaceae bacterium]|jgi:hypothetical protein
MDRAGHAVVSQQKPLRAAIDDDIRIVHSGLLIEVSELIAGDAACVDGRLPSYRSRSWSGLGSRQATVS